MNQQKNRAGLPLNGRGATINIIQDTEHLFGQTGKNKSDTNLGYHLAVSCFSRRYKDILIDWGNGNSSRYPDLESLSTLDKNSVLKNILEKATAGMTDNLHNHIYGYDSGNRAKAANVITDPTVLTGKWIVKLAPLIPNRERRPNNFGLMNIDPNKPAVFQADGSDLISRTYCMFDTEDEARNCYRYLGSDMVRAFTIAYKNGKDVRGVWKHIPWPATFDTDPALWTNEAISDRAGLDQKERDWLAEMLPDCYHVRKTKPAVSHDTAGSYMRVL
jgi:hypothetical protein